MKNKLINYFKAAFPGLAIQTTEEVRALSDIISAADACKKGVAVWSASEGLAIVKPDPRSIDSTDDLLPAIRERHADTVYIFRDAQTWPYERDMILARAIKDLLIWAPAVGSCVVFLGSSFKTHASFEKLVTVLDYTLPGAADLLKISQAMAESSDKKGLEISDDIVRALSGLSTSEAENALALSLVESGEFSSQIIYREKIQAVKKSGMLEIIDPDPRGLDSIGGLDILKSWVIKRKRAFTVEAEKFGLPAPKGVLLVGVPGTGKSLAAKAIGTALGLPTLRLDIGALFNSLVGESEARTREALKLAEALAPCVLWVDEIDKGLAGASGSGSGDSGVTRRVFGSIISWMQERRRPVFLVATANQVQSLPPELLRKGRFDEIFAIDLPSLSERIEILKIHIAKRNRKPSDFALDELAIRLDNFTGSEIESVIVEAMFDAFDSSKPLDSIFIKDVILSTVPLAVAAKEQINAIRSWADTRARQASTKETKKTEGRKVQTERK
jgi:ATP-dependent 26S proteasome regulatory subunit